MTNRSLLIASFISLASCVSGAPPADPKITLELYDVQDISGSTGVGDPGDGLDDLVRRNAAADAWSREGASINEQAGILIVRQTPPVHEEIRAFLAKLRGYGGSLVSLEISLIDGLKPAEFKAPWTFLDCNRANDFLDEAGRGARVTRLPASLVFSTQTTEIGMTPDLRWRIRPIVSNDRKFVTLEMIGDRTLTLPDRSAVCWESGGDHPRLVLLRATVSQIGK